MTQRLSPLEGLSQLGQGDVQAAIGLAGLGHCRSHGRKQRLGFGHGARQRRALLDPLMDGDEGGLFCRSDDIIRANRNSPVEGQVGAQEHGQFGDGVGDRAAGGGGGTDRLGGPGGAGGLHHFDRRQAGPAQLVDHLGGEPPSSCPALRAPALVAAR